MKNLASLLPPPLPPPPSTLVARDKFNTHVRPPEIYLREPRSFIAAYKTDKCPRPLLYDAYYSNTLSHIPDDRYPQSRNFPSYITITRFHESKHVVYYE